MQRPYQPTTVGLVVRGQPALGIALAFTALGPPTTSRADEAITRDVILGRATGEAPPDLIVCVLDATNLRLHLRFVLELLALGQPMLLVLNMMDDVRRRGIHIDVARLQARLGIAVLATSATRGEGLAELLARLDQPVTPPQPDLPPGDVHAQVRALLAEAVQMPARTDQRDDRLDALLLHPLWGLLILAAVLFVMFQAVFAGAAPFMDGIEMVTAMLGGWVSGAMPDGVLKSFLVDGVIAGAGGVVVFLPQILMLFLFILILEETGYLPRAAFLLDHLMARSGLSGRSFIPLLSSFACAVPGIMATRSIQDPRDRLATIFVAPLMTCSARLPVYALLIGAFVPDRSVGGFNLRGITLFGLYVAGVLSALGVAWVFKRLWLKSRYQPLMLELPPYRWPGARNLALGLWERARTFLWRVGTIIFSLMVLLWFLYRLGYDRRAFRTWAAIAWVLMPGVERVLGSRFTPAFTQIFMMLPALIRGLQRRKQPATPGSLAALIA